MAGSARRCLGYAWLAFGMAAGCASLSSLEAPEIELVALDVLGGSVGGQRFALTLLVSNPNPEPLAITEIRYSLRIAGEGYLNGRSAPVEVAASARQAVRVEITSEGVSSPSRLLALAQGPDDALEYELDGDLVLSGRPPRMLRFGQRGAVPLTVVAGN